MNEPLQKARGRLAPATIGALIVVGSAWLPLTALILGSKTHKVARLLGGLRAEPLLVALSGEILLLGAFGLAALLCVMLLRGWARRVALAAFAVGVAVAGVLTVVEHGFFLTTGVLLDGTLLRHALDHWADLSGVLLASTPATAVVAMALAATSGMVPLALTRLPGIAARLSAERPPWTWRDRRVAVPVGAFLVVMVAALVLRGRPLPGALEPLRAPAIASVVGGLFGAEEPQPAAEALERVEPLEIEAAPGARRYNVVIVELESTRAQSTTPYNPALPTTPNLARLAAKGALVRNAYTTIPHTSKSLVPMYCGIPPKPVITNDEALAGALPVECLPTLLRERGWATALFDAVDEAYEWGDLFARSFGFSTYRGPESLPREGFDRCSYFGYEDDILLEPALAWAERQSGPFLLAIITVAAHHQYQVPKGFPHHAWNTGLEDLDHYLDTLRYTDRFLGKLWDGLEARGLAKDTIFVVIGDHGEGFGEHQRFQHDAVIYEEGLRIPLVLVGPGITPGAVVEGLRQNADIVPTVLELLGMKVKGNALAGKSLLSTPGHDVLFFGCHYDRYCLGMREGDRSWVYHYDRQPMEVFDLASDPGQLYDLATMVPEAEVAAAKRAMLDWVARSLGRYTVQGENLVERFVRRQAWTAAHEVDLRYGDAVRLRGWDVQPGVLEPGDWAQVVLDFEALGTPDPGWSLFLHVIGPGDRQINADHVPVAGAYPLKRWRPGDFVRDRMWVRIPPDYPPGTYAIVLGFWNEGGDKARLQPTGSGAPVDDELRVHIGPLRVLPRK